MSSLRQKFEGVGCPRFGEDKESGAAVDKTKRVVVAGVREIQAIHDEAVADLRKENKALRQQIASQALEIAELKREKVLEKSVTGVTAKSAGKRGRKPTVTPEEKQQKSAARVKAWRQAKRKP